MYLRILINRKFTSNLSRAPVYFETHEILYMEY